MIRSDRPGPGRASLQCGVVLLLSFTLAGPTCPQASRDAEPVERAVARFVASKFRRKALGLESTPQEFATPHPPTGPSHANYRTPEHWAAVARDAGAIPVRSQGVKYCRTGSEADCVWAVIRIGVPTITGDSATVWLYVFEAIENDQMEEMDTKLLLVRTNGVWQFAKRLEMRSALFMKPTWPPAGPRG